QDIVAGTAVFCDVDLLCLPERLHELRRPVESLRPKRKPLIEHLWMPFGERNFTPTTGDLSWLIGGKDVNERPIDVDADEIERRAEDFQLVVSEFRRVRALLLQVTVSVFAFEHHR